MERINIMATNVFTELVVGGSGTDFSSSSYSSSPSDKVYCVDKSVPVNFSYTAEASRRWYRGLSFVRSLLLLRVASKC